MRKKLLETLQGNVTEIPPIWFMRQAGRYLEEYKAVRATTKSFLDFCYTPEKACEVTLQPIRRFGYDAAIIFSDILVIPDALGIEVQFVKNEGPQLKTVSPEEDISKLAFNIGHLKPVYQAISNTKASLPDETALIGFAGAPWTLATYMVEGKSSKEHQETRKIIYEHPDWFNQLIEVLIDAVSKHLIAQVDAGAEVLQLFDSWAGSLTPAEFETYALAPAAEIVKRIKAVHPDIPIIGFPRRAGHMAVPYAHETGISAIGFDQYANPEWIRDNINIPVQGNLDPLVLATDKSRACKMAEDLCECFSGKPYIFNLGHGILPFTPLENVQAVLDTVRKK